MQQLRVDQACEVDLDPLRNLAAAVVVMVEVVAAIFSLDKRAVACAPTSTLIPPSHSTTARTNVLDSTSSKLKVSG